DAAGRGDVEDGAGPLGLHRRDEGLRHQIDGAHVDVGDAVEGVVRQFVQRLGRVADTRVVDHDVDAAQQAVRGFGQSSDVSGAGYVDLHAQIGVAQFSGQGAGGILVQVGDDDAGAFLGEAARDSGAEAGGSARDDRSLALQPLRSVLPQDAYSLRYP